VAGKDTNILIKPDGSSGRVISSEEAEQYEIARTAQEAQEVAKKDARSKARDLAKKSKRVAKEAKDAEKVELARLTKADLELWEAAVTAWREIMRGWQKGDGKTADAVTFFKEIWQVYRKKSLKPAGKIYGKNL